MTKYLENFILEFRNFFSFAKGSKKRNLVKILFGLYLSFNVYQLSRLISPIIRFWLISAFPGHTAWLYFAIWQAEEGIVNYMAMIKVIRSSEKLVFTSVMARNTLKKLSASVFFIVFCVIGIRAFYKSFFSKPSDMVLSSAKN